MYTPKITLNFYNDMQMAAHLVFKSSFICIWTSGIHEELIYINLLKQHLKHRAVAEVMKKSTHTKKETSLLIIHSYTWLSSRKEVNLHKVRNTERLAWCYDFYLLDLAALESDDIKQIC